MNTMAGLAAKQLYLFFEASQISPLLIRKVANLHLLRVSSFFGTWCSVNRGRRQLFPAFCFASFASVFPQQQQLRLKKKNNQPRKSFAHHEDLRG